MANNQPRTKLHNLKIRRSSQITGLARFRENTDREVQRRLELIADLERQIAELEAAEKANA